MDGLAALEPGSIVAPLNFLVPMAERPVAYNYEPPPGTPVAHRPRASNTRFRSAMRGR